MSSDDEDGPLQHEVHNSNSSELMPSLNYVIGCKSDHTKFVASKDFNSACLPEDIQCPEVLNLINLNIDLTVMVCVNR